MFAPSRCASPHNGVRRFFCYNNCVPYDIIESEGKFCVRNSETREVKKCYDTREKALRLLRALYANVEDATRSAEDQVDEVYKRYHELVNMSASELERWAESECSKKASLSRAPIKRNLHLLRMPKERWGAREVSWAKKTISFISRMRNMEQGKPVSEGCPSKRDISLMNWAYRPSSNRADLRAWIPPAERVLCQRSAIEDVQRPELIAVLAMPFEVVDRHNTYFTARTDRRLDIVPENVPVFDWHGLGGTAMDVQPIGKTVGWRKTDEGWWAIVELNKDDPRFNDFVRAASECRLGASVGMLPAAMYPRPPIGGVYEEPTELLQAPVSELSLIIMDDIKQPSNPKAMAGYNFSRGEVMCKDCEQQNSAEALRAELEALRAKMETMEKELEREKAEKEEMMRRRKYERSNAAAQRMSHELRLPQSIVDEFLNLYNSMPEGDQDKLMDAVGRLVDHMRAEVTTHASANSESLRAVLVRQQAPAQVSSNDERLSKLAQETREWLKSVRRVN